MEREAELSRRSAVKLDDGGLFSDVVKPLVRGCLTGEINAQLNYARGLMFTHNAHLVHHLKLANLQKYKQQLRVDVLIGATYTTASFGLFEILTKKIRSKINDGSPLSLYQEAFCGLASGATAVFIGTPIITASSQTSEHGYRNLFSTTSHIVGDKGVLALWRGKGLYMSSLLTGYMGMLTSYDRTLDYLTESKGLPKWQAQMSASIVSGFFAAACSHPCRYVKAMKDAVKQRYDDGEKSAYKNIPRYVSRILTPYGGHKFYAGFLPFFGRWAPFCMVQWYIYKRVQETEQFMDQGKLTVGYLGKD